MSKPCLTLFLDGSRGVHLPRAFAQLVHRHLVTGVTEADWAILDDGPDNEDYWDTWTDVVDNALLTVDGVQYTLYQDDDLFVVPVGMEWSDTENTYVWPEEV